MKLSSYEFKARLKDEQRVRAVLKKLGARFVGTDHQVDTYFRVPRGRLKLREGNIENALIFYMRPDARQARASEVRLVQLPSGNSIRGVLSAALGELARVDKRREIYFAGKVKIHLDRVRGLGRFLEVEAIQKRRAGRGQPEAGPLEMKIRRQALRLQKLFGVAGADIIPISYSDMILNKRGTW